MFRRFGFIVFSMFIVISWASWTMFHYDAQNTGRAPYAPLPCDSTAISVVWSTYLGDAVRSSPALSLSNDTIYVASNNDTLYALSHGGVVLWRFPLTGDALFSSPAVDSTGDIYIGCNSETLYCVTPAGARVWARKCVSQYGMWHSPTIDHKMNRVYINSFYTDAPNWFGWLNAFQLDGTTLWQEHPAGSGGWFVTCPAVDENHYIFTVDYANSPGGLTCFDTLGSVIWTHSVPIAGEIDFQSSPAIDTARNRIYWGGQDYGSNPPCQRIYAVDYTYTTHTDAWSFHMGGPVQWCTPAIRSDGSIVLGANNGILRCFDPAGSELWNYPCGSAIISSPAIDGDDNIYVGCSDGNFYGFWSDGSLRFRLSLDGSAVWSSPAIAEDNRIYVGTNGGYLHCIEIGPCDEEGLVVYPRFVEPCSWFSFWVRNEYPTEVAESTWVSVMPVYGDSCVFYIEHDTFAVTHINDTAAYVNGFDIPPSDSAFVTFYLCPNPSCDEGDSICIRAEAFTSNPLVHGDADTICFELNDCDSCHLIDEPCVTFHSPFDWTVVPCDSPVCFLWSTCCWNEHCWGDTIFLFIDLYVDDSLIAESLYCCHDWICDSFIDIPFDQPPLCPYYPSPGDTHTFYMIAYSDCDSAISDTGHIIALPCCFPAITWMECPFPCWNFSSCGGQVMMFGIMDTSGAEIDTMQVYFTSITCSDIGECDTTWINEPSSLLSFSGDVFGIDSLIAIVSDAWSDGDSVAITLDSAFTISGCRIYPP